MGNNHTRNAAKYHKHAGRQYHLWMHTSRDADIIKQLDSVKNKQGYIKALIRYDIKRGNQ